MREMIAGLGLLLWLAGSAAEPERPVASSSRFTLLDERCEAAFDAESTFHDFTGKTRAVSGWIEADLADLAPAAGAISIEAAALDTGNKGRDKDMREELKTAEHPAIAFALAKVEDLRWKVPGREGTFTLVGTLSIAGKTREVRIPASGRLGDDGLLRVSGETSLKMSDYGVRPPSSFLIARVADEVRIRFSITARKTDGK